VSKGTLDKRLDALQARIAPRSSMPAIPEWLHWTTTGELMRLEELYRAAEVADLPELSESDQHHAMAVYSAAMARMLDAPPEVRADPEARDAYVREIEDRNRPRWYP
jgi:hypothetical protein